jgi:hypothetical protein
MTPEAEKLLRDLLQADARGQSKLTPELAEQIRQAIEEGRSVKWISKALRIARTTLRRWISERLVRRPRTLPSPEKQQAIPAKERKLLPEPAAFGICVLCNRNTLLVKGRQYCPTCFDRVKGGPRGKCDFCGQQDAELAIVKSGTNTMGVCVACHTRLSYQRKRRNLAEFRRREQAQVRDVRFATGYFDTRYDPPRWIE